MTVEEEKSFKLQIEEEKSLRNEIDTLNKNIERKDAVIAGLLDLIIKTENVELISKANEAMLSANLKY